MKWIFAKSFWFHVSDSSDSGTSPPTVLCIAVKVAVSTWNWLKTVTFMTSLCQSMHWKLSISIFWEIFSWLVAILPDRTRRISPSRRKREKKPFFSVLSILSAKWLKSKKLFKYLGQICKLFYIKFIILWWNTFNMTVYYMLYPLLSVFDILTLITNRHPNSIW